MVIGIDASRACVRERTGIEEYSYQIIKELRSTVLARHDVMLYTRKGQTLDFDVPLTWKIKELWLPMLWTQIRLSVEMLVHPVDTLFIPAHVVPVFHSKNTVVTVHGLEYEHMPQAYSAWDRRYMRWSIKNSCRWARKIIAVSDITKNDLMNVYGISEKKIKVVHEGHGGNSQFLIPNSQFPITGPYFFYVGRIERRKNILGIVEAFEIVKKKHHFPHKLVLAGKAGYGYEEIKSIIDKSNYASDIVLTGFISEEEKWNFMQHAEIFLFPTWSEGFGLPVLEAQSMGVPVITSDTSLMREIVGESAILVDPAQNDIIAENIAELVGKKNLQEELKNKGYENIRRFCWNTCARRVAEVLTEE